MSAKKGSKITTAFILTSIFTSSVITETSTCRRSFSNMPPGALVEISYECTIRSAADFWSIPDDATSLTLIYPISAAPSLFSSRDSVLPANLGGSMLASLSILVSNFPSLTSRSTPTAERQFPAGMFANLPKLQILQLYHQANGAVDFSLRLTNGSFDGLSGLRILRLSRLGITELPTAVFRGLTSIVNIDLSQNRIRRIARGTFEVTDSVDVFPSFSNFSTSVPGATASTLPSISTRCCRELAVLSLGLNDVTDISDVSLHGLDRLKRIDLHGNRLTSIDKAAFAVVYDSLIEMNLAANRIAQLDDSSLSGLRRLEVLYVENNAISKISPGGTFGFSLPNLTALYLDDNRITFLGAGTFRGTPSLKTLSIQANEISRIDSGAFQGLNKLQRLNLRRNKLTTFDAAQMTGIGPFLAELDLSGNLITALTENGVNGSAPGHGPRWSDFIGSSMTILSVAANQLTALPTSFLERISSARSSAPGYVYLHDNRWHCDCQLYATVVRRLLVRGQHGAVDDVATCSTPTNLSGVPLASAFVNDNECEGELSTTTALIISSKEPLTVTSATAAAAVALTSVPVSVVTATAFGIVLVIIAVCLLIQIHCRLRQREIWNRWRNKLFPPNAVNVDTAGLRRRQQTNRPRHVISVAEYVAQSVTTPTSSAAVGDSPPRYYLWPTFDNLAANLKVEVGPPSYAAAVAAAAYKTGSRKIQPHLQPDVVCKMEQSSTSNSAALSRVPSASGTTVMTSSHSQNTSDCRQDRSRLRQSEVDTASESNRRDDLVAQRDRNHVDRLTDFAGNSNELSTIPDCSTVSSLYSYRAVPTDAFTSRSVPQSSIYCVPDRNDTWTRPVPPQAQAPAAVEPYEPPPPYREICLGRQNCRNEWICKLTAARTE